MKKIILLLLIITFINSVSLSAAAGELPFTLSGDLKIKYIYQLADKNHLDQTDFTLQIEKNFAYTAGFYLQFGLESYSQYLRGDKAIKTDLLIKEGYFDYYTENIDWRAGRQILNWGSSYNLKPSNYFNPIDPGAINPLESREGIEALQARYYLKNNQEITAVIGLRDSIDDPQQALKFTKRRWQGFDLSFSLFSGQQLEAIKSKYYPEVKKAAFDLRGDITKKDIGIFSEIVYSNFKAELFNNSLEAVIGFDYKFKNNFYLLGQYYYQEKIKNNLDNSQIISIHAERPFWQFHNWEADLLYDLNSKFLLLRPKLIYSLAEGLELEAGAVFKTEAQGQSRLDKLTEELIYIGINSYF